VRHRLESGLLGENRGNAQARRSVFPAGAERIVGSNRLAVDAAAVAARERGYRPVVLSTLIEGETRDVAGMHAAILKEAIASGRPARPPVCFISGGETTVTLRGEGLGGRTRIRPGLRAGARRRPGSARAERRPPTARTGRPTPLEPWRTAARWKGLARRDSTPRRISRATIRTISSTLWAT